MRMRALLALVAILALVGVASAGPPAEQLLQGDLVKYKSCGVISAAASPAPAIVDSYGLAPPMDVPAAPTFVASLDDQRASGYDTREVVGILPHRVLNGQGWINNNATKGKAVLKISHAADFQHRHVST